MSDGNSLLGELYSQNQEVKSSQDLCRCCHAKGKFKNLAESCSDNGEDEIFADMLKYCFDVEILPIPGRICAVTYNICEVCINLLRDATRFKRSVLACEAKLKALASCDEIFKKFFTSNAILVENENEPIVKVKVEKQIEETNEGNIYDNDLSAHEWDFVDEENKLNLEDIVETTEKCVMKSKKSKKKINKDKKIKKEPIPYELQPIKVVQPKFYLKDEDYTIDGSNFVCKNCNKTYTKYCSLRFHIKRVHYKITRLLKCPVCNKEFKTITPLTKHKLDEHSIDDRFKCNACKGAFSTSSQLKRHINSFHMLGEKYKCEFCDYESFSFESLYKHKVKHKTSKDHQCKFCRKTFLRKTTKDLHERIHTGDRRKVCTVCGQAFVQKASLNYHMTKYHPEVNF